MDTRLLKLNAIMALRPNTEFHFHSDESIEWITDGVEPLTSEEIQTKYDEMLAAIPLNELRAVRNQKLAETDWTQNRDVTLANDADWQTYRQALRDITDTYTSLDDVVWPEKP